MKEVSKKHVALQRNNVPKFTVPPTNVETGKHSGRNDCRHGYLIY